MRALSSTPAASRACQCTKQPRLVCHSSVSDAHVEASRRALLATLATAAAVSAEPACAEVELTTLYGLATPPTSYGGYGGNVKEAPKYKFLYPASWKELTVNKVQKVRACYAVPSLLLLHEHAAHFFCFVYRVAIFLDYGFVAS